MNLCTTFGGGLSCCVIRFRRIKNSLQMSIVENLAVRMVSICFDTDVTTWTELKQLCSSLTGAIAMVDRMLLLPWSLAVNVNVEEFPSSQKSQNLLH
jgi:hypothetical protein